MLNDLGASALLPRARKTALIVLAALAVVAFVAAAVYAACCPTFGLPGDMMPPDDTITIVQGGHGHGGGPYRYKAVVHTHDTLKVTRNGVLWVTVRQNGGWYEISDPRGTGQPVIKLRAPGGPPAR